MGPSMRCVVAFLCAVLGSAASNSEVAHEISQLGATELCEYSLKLIETHFKGMTVPDQQRSLNLFLVCDVPYELCAIHGQKGKCLKCAVRVNPDSVIEMSFTNCNFNLNGSWAVANGKGPFVASVSELSMNTAVIVTKDDTGNTSFKLLRCSCSGGGLSSELYGQNSKLYQLFSGMVADSMLGVMYSQVCDETRKVIEGLGEQLTSTQGSPWGDGRYAVNTAGSGRLENDNKKWKNTDDYRINETQTPSA